ncbi:uncharacterized protein A1O5_01506 [Cladophialophora psammophila CBS 110553]|uniref:DUF676 domain-containing protein n=1 Tax=Cladophialophora psammophila CBS 110553 TaxID=1182543 RepID=W9XBT5_9EURO|nr:uncharacterized protein A1O5_01506 [Cladophialophora psammophila CBS 110553]EXJ74810.1 hypothetical protein A1O5_01506 [Cladophialophora psammophila CBS 110553]
MILCSEVPALIPSPPESNGFDCFVVYPTTSTPYKAEKSEPTVDFVFIHGITGSQTATWTAENDQGVKVLWPRDLLPDKIPDCRVIMYGYDANVVNFWAEASQNCLYQHARDLFNSRPIIFVVHSMGGLVVADALHRAKDALDRYEEDVYHLTYAIAFLGTPHLGAELASWASVGAKFLYPFKRTNVRLVKVLETRSEELRDIQQRFHLMLRKRAMACSKQPSDSPYPIKLYCFYESEALKIVGKVVEEKSAVLSDWGSASIHANHMGMTRFPHENDDGFRRVCGRLSVWVKELRDRRSAQASAQIAVQTATMPGATQRSELEVSKTQGVEAPTSVSAQIPPATALSPLQQHHQQQQYQPPRLPPQQAAEPPSETPDPGQEQPTELPDRPAQQGRGEHPKQQPAYFPIGQPVREKKHPKKSKKSQSSGPTFNFNGPRGGQWQVAGGDINNRGRAFGGKTSNVKGGDSKEDDSSEESAGGD